MPAVRLELFPKSTIDVFITIIEADGIESSIASGAIAASVALAHAGIEMIGLVVSCSAVSTIFQEVLIIPYGSFLGSIWGRSLVGPD